LTKGQGIHWGREALVFHWGGEWERIDQLVEAYAEAVDENRSSVEFRVATRCEIGIPSIRHGHEVCQTAVDRKAEQPLSGVRVPGDKTSHGGVA
jgi:hypothetical protein